MTIGASNLPKIPATKNEYLFAKPFLYQRRTFGLRSDVRDESVISFSLDISVSQMSQDFRIFEDLPNVHEWPVSKLIQRELDKQRAAMMCRDYLLSNGYLKYFPPIIAVLIPTNANMHPSDSFGVGVDEEFHELKKYIKSQLGEEWGNANVKSSSVLARGVYDVVADELLGYLTWDKNAVSAVIIDGQHRFKSLIEAMRVNGDFQKCMVNINVIDLVSLSARLQIGPTTVARDLFVSINNTPVEVDESRLILMDDRDALATFTQVLVDDSDNTFPPIVPPELIDWRCDQGKHDINLAITGILTLRGVIGAAMFNNTAMASVDDRSNSKQVRNWLQAVELWLSPDDEIQKEIGQSETLRFRFSLATAEDHDEDDQRPFLFSYSSAVAAIMKRKFKELYLGVFRDVYSKLTPYEEVRRIAVENGALDQGKLLHKYLRAFTSQRADLIRENNDLYLQVSKYKSDLKKAGSQNNILLTVMGQKSVFKALFSEYLSDCELNVADLSDSANRFVLVFNEVYAKLNLSVNFDECFFSTAYSLPGIPNHAKAKELRRTFWKGVILGKNGEIDYAATSVDILKSIIVDVVRFQNLLGEEVPDKFLFTQKNKIIKRHQNIIQKDDSDIDDEDAFELAEKIVSEKERGIYKLLISP